MQENLGFLVGEARNLHQDYSRWGFDTSRFDDSKFLGHQSEGFQHILNSWFRFNHTAPGNGASGASSAKVALAFFNPHYSPWAPVEYSGKPAHPGYFEFNPKHWEEIKAYLAGQWPKDKPRLEKIDFFNFLQAGISHRAKLTLVELPPIRPIQWFHLPIRRIQPDDAYFHFIPSPFDRSPRRTGSAENPAGSSCPRPSETGCSRAKTA